MRRIIACTLAVFSVLIVSGHNLSDSVKVYFSINQGWFDPSLRDNAASMEAFICEISAAVSSNNLDHIAIYGYASPDGPASLNERLAKKRCEAIAAYIVNRTGIGPDLVQARPEGIAWDELRRLVADDRDVPSREQILEILDSTSVLTHQIASQGGESERKKLLQSLAGGMPYKWMLDNIFPQLRYSFAVSVYLKSDNFGEESASGTETPLIAPDETNISEAAEAEDAHEIPVASVPDVADSLHTADADDSASTAITEAPQNTDAEDSDISAGHIEAGLAALPEPVQEKPSAAGIPYHRFAIKTNMLYYAALMPNIELEWLVNKHWSVSAEWNIAWWADDPNFKSYRISEIGAEARYWIKPRAPWHGMYAGLFAGGAWYDLENYKGALGEGMMTGASFGYMWPVGKNFSLSAEVGVGYVYTRYKVYEPYEGHFLYMRTKSLNYIGPVMLKFSIACRFSDRNKSKRYKSEHEE